MAQEWDYAGLARLAKENGGPARLLATIKTYNFQQGVAKGKLLQRPKIILAFGIGAAVTFAASQAPRIIRYFGGKPKEKEIMSEEAEEAEKMLIEGIEKAEQQEVEQSAQSTERAE